MEIRKGRLVFVTGGTRSGKSDFALSLAESANGRKVYLATAEALDDEMKERVRLHRTSRPSGFDTLEEPRDIVSVLSRVNGEYDVVLLDCLTLWLSNIFENLSSQEIVEEARRVFNITKASGFTLIVVSNELGMGVVPENSLARKFRDIGGKLNQLFAAASEEVYFVVSGIPVKIKSGYL